MLPHERLASLDCCSLMSPQLPYNTYLNMLQNYVRYSTTVTENRFPTGQSPFTLCSILDEMFPDCWIYAVAAMIVDLWSFVKDTFSRTSVADIVHLRGRNNEAIGLVKL